MLHGWWLKKWLWTAVQGKMSPLPSDLQPFLIVWTEKLKGLVDLHTLSPVLPNIEL